MSSHDHICGEAGLTDEELNLLGFDGVNRLILQQSPTNAIANSTDMGDSLMRILPVAFVNALDLNALCHNYGFWARISGLVLRSIKAVFSEECKRKTVFFVRLRAIRISGRRHAMNRPSFSHGFPG